MVAPTSDAPEPSSKPVATEVFFDGSCPLCAREISLYQRQTGAEAITWTDVSSGATGTDDLDCTVAMARFHVRDQNGNLVSGAHGFLALWRALPAWKVAANVLSIGPIPSILELAYKGFLPLRPALARILPPPKTKPDVTQSCNNRAA